LRGAGFRAVLRGAAFFAVLRGAAFLAGVFFGARRDGRLAAELGFLRLLFFAVRLERDFFLFTTVSPRPLHYIREAFHRARDIS